MLERHEEPTGGVVLDARWFPVVIGTWWGEPSPALLDALYAWVDRMLERAREEGTKVVLVFDALDVTRASSAMRRRLAAESDARQGLLRERVLGIFVVVRGAFVLGLVAAILSIVRPSMRLSSFASPEAALERALVKLLHARVPFPVGLDPRAYVRPSRGGA